MDILNRRLLEVGEPCYYFVSSTESPYIYIRFSGIISEVFSIKEEQIIYRVEPIEVLENEEIITKYINRNHYRVFDLNAKVNRTKRFYTFDIDTNDFIEKCVKNKFTFEVPSALIFDTEKQMNKEFKICNNYITNLLQDTINEIMNR